MRKINDSELFSMLQSGKSRKECAEHFNCSLSAISQRETKARMQVPSEAFSRLTSNQQLFVLQKASGKGNMEAVKASGYDVSSDESARSMGTVLMKTDDVRLALSEIMLQEGLSPRRRIQRLRDMILCQDFTSVGKGLDMSWKLDGSYAPSQINVAVDYNPVFQRERLNELRRMLAEADSENVITISES